MSDKHSTPQAPEANELKLTDEEKMDLRDGLQAWAGLLRTRSAQERLRARLSETAVHPDHVEAEDSHACAEREEEGADRLDRLTEKIDASIGLGYKEQP